MLDRDSNHEDDFMTAALNRLEDHLLEAMGAQSQRVLEILQTQARHSEALAGINRRLDVLNGKVATQEAKSAEQSERLLELAASQRQDLAEHSSTCEVRALVEEIRRLMAAEAATEAANHSWWAEIKPILKAGLTGLLWVLAALAIFHFNELVTVFK